MLKNTRVVFSRPLQPSSLVLYQSLEYGFFVKKDAEFSQTLAVFSFTPEKRYIGDYSRKYLSQIA